MERSEVVNSKTNLQILFKSGTSIFLKVDDLQVSYSGDQITKLVWNNSEPKMMFISLHEIAAIFNHKE